MAAASVTGAALAQAPATDAARSYPNRLLRFVVAFPPGASTDIVGRIVGARRAELGGQNVVIENRSGAGGNIGTQTGARANPDGYTASLEFTPNTSAQFARVIQEEIERYAKWLKVSGAKAA